MKWISVKDQLPDPGTSVLYFDGDVIHNLIYGRDGKFYSYGYFCNNHECSWTFDDCQCEFLVKPGDYWMPLPDPPKDE